MPRPPALNPDGTRKHPPRERDAKRAQRKAGPSAESLALVHAKPRPLPIDFTDDDAPPRNPIAERMKRAKANVAALVPDEAAPPSPAPSPAEVAAACASGSPDAPAMLAQAKADNIVRAGHIILTCAAACACFEADQAATALTTLSGILPMTCEAERELARRLLPWRFAPVIDLL